MLYTPRSKLFTLRSTLRCLPRRALRCLPSWALRCLPRWTLRCTLRCTTWHAPIAHVPCVHISSRCSCGKFKIILLGVCSSEFLPFDRVLSDCFITAEKKITIDMASHTFTAKIKVALLIATIVAKVIEYGILTASFANKSCENWLWYNSTCILS